MSFATPWALILLLMPLAVRQWVKLRKTASAAMRLPSAIFAAAEPAPRTEVHTRARFAIWFLSWSMIVVALAGPQVLREAQSLPISGRDIFLALDMSGSMEKADFDLEGQNLTRLDAVKRVASGFVQSRNGDRVGLTLFGDRAYIAVPLTHDLDIVADAINEAQIGISGKSTAISDGLGLSMKRLKESDAQSRVVVLLSDGVDTSGKVNPDDAASLAKSLGIRVHTIALGPEDIQSNPNAKDAVDADTLGRIAEISGGERFRVHNMGELQAVAKAIDALEPTPQDAPPLIFWQEYWVWPAALGLLLLSLGAWLEWRRK